MLAPAGEKALYKILLSGGTPDPTGLPKVARENPTYRVLTAALDGFLQFQSGSHDRARELLAWVFAQHQEISEHEFSRKYLAGASITVEVCDGISVALPLDTSTVALAVAELHQAAGDLDAAIATVEQIDPPTTIGALDHRPSSPRRLRASRRRRRHHNQITNVDDATALLCVFRGVALREQGHHDAAREAFKEALKSRTHRNGSQSSCLHRAADAVPGAEQERDGPQGPRTGPRRRLLRPWARRSSRPASHLTKPGQGPRPRLLSRRRRAP